MGHGPKTLLTGSEWVAFSLLHCVSLRNVVELWQPPKLLPDSVVVEEGPHGIVNIPNKALWEIMVIRSAGSGREPTGETSLSSLSRKQQSKALEAEGADVSADVRAEVSDDINH